MTVSYVVITCIVICAGRGRQEDPEPEARGSSRLQDHARGPGETQR